MNASRLARVWPYLAATLAALLLYLPTLGYGFVYDDLPLVVHNEALAPGAPLRALLTRDVDALWRGTDEVQSNYYRPLAFLMLAGLRCWLGVEPRAWHAATLLAHALASLLAVALLRRFGCTRLAAGLGGVLFALHPAHVSAAAWVSGLQDLLLALGASAAVLAYLAACARPSAPRLVAVGATYLLALGTKEAAVGLLLFACGHLLLARWLPGRERLQVPAPAPRLLWTLAGATLAYLAVRYAVLGTLARPFPGAPGALEALASIPIALAAYLRLLVWPVGLGLLHPARPVTQLFAPVVWLGLGACLAASILIASLLRRRAELALPVLWFGAWLAPCLNLWAVNPEWIVMDRYLYLPMLTLPWLLVGSMPSPPSRLRATLLMALALAWGLLSIAPREAFRDERAFWARQVQVDPGSSVAWTEQARLLGDAGQLETARAALQRAQALDPRALLPELRLALLDVRVGAPDAAAQRLAVLTQRSPGYLPAWRNLPVALARAGRVAEALDAARAAAARHPRDVDVLANLAVLARQRGLVDEALDALARARAVNPHDGLLLLREATLLAEVGQAQAARQRLEQAAEVQATPALRKQLDALRDALEHASARPSPTATP